MSADITTHRLRELADCAQKATVLTLTPFARGLGWPDEAYAQAVEDVLRWLAGDTGQTPELTWVLNQGSHTARLTAINEEEHDGWWDTMTIFDAADEFVDAVKVRPSEDEAPYIAALAEDGWRVVSNRPGDEDWAVVRADQP